jgi:hypothetical protein
MVELEVFPEMCTSVALVAGSREEDQESKAGLLAHTVQLD